MKTPAIVGLLLTLTLPAIAGHNEDSAVWSGVKKGPVDSAWVVQFPTNSSDFFDATYNVIAGIGNAENETLAAGLPITGVAVSVADFGSGRSYASVGVFNSNLGIDPTGQTPDLSSPISMVSSPALSPPALFDFVPFNLSEGAIPGGATRVHAVVQLPPGDSGLLAVGADNTTSARGGSGFTSDGYSTPSSVLTFLDFGLNPGQDNSATTSCKQSDRKPHGRLRASRVDQGIGEGDHLTQRICGGEVLNLSFFGTKSGDRFRLYFNVAPCTPAVAIGPVLPTISDGDGDGSYLRVNAEWPKGYAGNTFRFSAVWGNPACGNPGVGFTNCVTLIVEASSFESMSWNNQPVVLDSGTGFSSVATLNGLITVDSTGVADGSVGVNFDDGSSAVIAQVGSATTITDTTTGGVLDLLTPDGPVDDALFNGSPVSLLSLLQSLEAEIQNGTSPGNMPAELRTLLALGTLGYTHQWTTNVHAALCSECGGLAAGFWCKVAINTACAGAVVIGATLCAGCVGTIPLFGFAVPCAAICAGAVWLGVQTLRDVLLGLWC